MGVLGIDAEIDKICGRTHEKFEGNVPGTAFIDVHQDVIVCLGYFVVFYKRFYKQVSLNFTGSTRRINGISVNEVTLLVHM